MRPVVPIRPADDQRTKAAGNVEKPPTERHSSESWNPVPLCFKGLEALDPSFRWDDELGAGSFEVPYYNLRMISPRSPIAREVRFASGRSIRHAP